MVNFTRLYEIIIVLFQIFISQITKSMKKELPSFITNNASGEDLLENQPHESVAKLLFNIITNQDDNYSSLDNHVIGLEGEWGSGKTNVIKNFQTKLKDNDKKYFVFNYDVWGHQEDLTRRSFLEELIDDLLDKKSNYKWLKEENVDWIETKNELVAKYSTIHRNKFPKVKLYVLGLSLTLTSWIVLKELAEIWSSCLTPLNKTFLIFIIPALFFILSLISIISDYNEIELDENEKDKNDFTRFLIKLSRVLYWLNGKEIKSHEKENIIEEEPSVKRFQQFYYKILGDFNGDGLIIVFDNMDRVSSTKKLMEVWSSIHTFFADADGERKGTSNVWTIIPYDKKNLAELLKHENGGNTDENKKFLNEFLHKTFSLSFRIAPPVMSSWKSFFRIKFQEAFKNIDISEEDVEIIATLFKLSTDTTKIKPREIISFINGLVSLYLQHSDKGIDVKYLALSLLSQDRINEGNPVINMISGKYLQSESYLFPNEQELTQNIASVYYNIPKENAQQLLLRNSIEEVLRNFSDKAFGELVENPGFKEQVDVLLSEVEYTDYPPEHITEFLEMIGESLNYYKDSLWSAFASSLLNAKENDGYFKTTEPWLLNLIRKSPIALANKVAEKITEVTYKLEGAKIYYTLRFEMYKIREEVPELTIPFKFKKIKASEFLDFCKFHNTQREIFEKYFQKIGIRCDREEDLDNIFQDILNDSQPWEIKDYLGLIQFLYEKQNFKFIVLREKVTSLFKTLNHTQEHLIIAAIALNRIFKSSDGVLKTFESGVVFNIFANNNSAEKIYFANITSMMIALHVNGVRRGESEFSHITFDEDKIAKIAKVVEDYVPIDNLLQFVVSNNLSNNFLADLIVQVINIENEDRKFNKDWVYKNIQKIQTKIFDGDENLEFINEFEKFITKAYLPDFSNIDYWWFEKITVELLADHQAFQVALNSYYSWIEDGDIDWWFERLTNPQSLTIRCSNAIFGKGLEDKSKVVSNNLLQAVEKVLVDIASGDRLIPDNQLKFLKNHYPLFKRNVLKRIANNCLDNLLDHSKILPDMLNQLDDFIFEYSSSFTDQDQSEKIKRKIIIHSYNENPKSFEKLVFSYTNKLIKILEYRDDQNMEIKELLLTMRKELETSNPEGFVVIDRIIKESELNRK